MTSNSARRTATPTTMTTPVSIGLWSARRDVCYGRVTATVRPEYAAVQS
jgi:hypothetical protein